MAAECSDFHCWHNGGQYPHNMPLERRVMVYAYTHYSESAGWRIVYDQMSDMEILGHLFRLNPGGMYDIPCYTIDDVLSEDSLLMKLIALWNDRHSKAGKVPF